MAMKSDYIKSKLDGNVRALNDIVVIRKLEDYHDELIGGVALPLDYKRGFNMTKGVVESIGPIAKKENFEVGDVVLYYHFAAHGLTHPLVCVNIENVICKVLPE